MVARLRKPKFMRGRHAVPKRYAITSMRVHMSSSTNYRKLLALDHRYAVNARKHVLKIRRLSQEQLLALPRAKKERALRILEIIERNLTDVSSLTMTQALALLPITELKLKKILTVRAKLASFEEHGAVESRVNCWVVWVRNERKRLGLED